MGRFVSADNLIQETGDSPDIISALTTLSTALSVLNSAQRSANKQDPARFDPQLLNRYFYVANNPASRSDPTGHFFLPLVTGAIGFGAGFVGSVAGQMFGGQGSFSERLQAVRWDDAAIAGGVGFVAGVAAPFVATTYLGAAALGGISNGAQYLITQKWHKAPWTYGELGFNVGIGVVAGFIAGLSAPKLPKSVVTEKVTRIMPDPVMPAIQRWSAVNRAVIESERVRLSVVKLNLGRSLGSGIVSNYPIYSIFSSPSSNFPSHEANRLKVSALGF